jgi:hypothetical protein
MLVIMRLLISFVSPSLFCSWNAKSYWVWPQWGGGLVFDWENVRVGPRTLSEAVIGQ